MVAEDLGLEMFSPAWFARARDLTQAVMLPDDCSCRLQFDAGGTRWFLVMSRGRVIGFDLGSRGAPGGGLRGAPRGAGGAGGGGGGGPPGGAGGGGGGGPGPPAALDATTVAASWRDGTYVGRPAPSNLSVRDEIAAMPAVPGATFGVQYMLRDGP